MEYILNYNNLGYKHFFNYCKHINTVKSGP